MQPPPRITGQTTAPAAPGVMAPRPTQPSHENTALPPPSPIYLSPAQMQYLGILEDNLKKCCRLVKGIYQGTQETATVPLSVTLAPVSGTLAPEQDMENVLRNLLSHKTIFAYAKGDRPYQFHIRITADDRQTEDRAATRSAQWIVGPLSDKEMPFYTAIVSQLQQRQIGQTLTVDLKDLDRKEGPRVLDALLLQGKIKDWAYGEDSFSNRFILKVSEEDTSDRARRGSMWRSTPESQWRNEAY